MTATRLAPDRWRALEAEHAARADALTAGHRMRRSAGEPHPVEDFLFEYYNNPPGKLRRWHPGPGVTLEQAVGMPRASWRCYRTFPDGSVALDVAAFSQERSRTISFVQELLSATLSRPPQTGCFGLHEWAMVYRLAPERIRHHSWPLRLSAKETDEVVEAHQIRCSHFDAYRFFTPEAAPRNALRPTRESQAALEQPGCLHAGMDVYKWAFKLSPLTPGELVLDAFALAREIRTLDMRASPYDLRDLGYDPVAIETAEGKAAYARAQREFADRTDELRRRLLVVLGHCGRGHCG